MASCKECIHKTVCAVYNDSLRETLERGGTMLCQCGEYFPTADVVEVKHGKWYSHDKKIHGDTCYHCSVCERMPLTDCGMVWELTPYCPYCGAKMDGDSNV